VVVRVLTAQLYEYFRIKFHLSRHNPRSNVVAKSNQ
jgi:hypothetical protein